MMAWGRGTGTKYGNKKTEYGGVLWDSGAEALYAQHLDLLKAAGQIHDWGRGYAIELLPAIALLGGRATRTVYTPDFFVMESPTMVGWFVEVKGVPTETWKLRMRLLRQVHPTLRLKVVKTNGEERWL